MADKSRIQWTDATWNYVTGCTKVSPGCAHCYAEAVTLRFKRGSPYLPGLATIETHPDRLDLPRSWKRPRRIFVNSVSDLFHEEVSENDIHKVFHVMNETERHTFQILTKRHQRLEQIADQFYWSPNIWMGVSVENQYWADQRIPALLKTPAKTKFLSVEPMLKPVDLTSYLPHLDWVIVGGESGPKARPIQEDWVRTIRDDCSKYKVLFFFKQWGGATPNAGGHQLDGETYQDMPTMYQPVVGH